LLSFSTCSCDIKERSGQKGFWLTVVSYLPTAIFNIRPTYLALLVEKKKRGKRKLLLDLEVFQSGWRAVTQALSWAVAELGPISALA